MEEGAFKILTGKPTGKRLLGRPKRRWEDSQDMLDSTNSDPDFINTIITDDESWVYEYDPESKSFRHFPYNENPTRAINSSSLKCCLPSTNANDR